MENITQFKDACLAAARIYGWKGESQVNVEVNNQVGVVVSEAKRKELHLRAIQDDDDNERPAPKTAPLPAKNAATGQCRPEKIAPLRRMPQPRIQFLLCQGARAFKFPRTSYGLLSHQPSEPFWITSRHSPSLSVKIARGGEL